MINSKYSKLNKKYEEGENLGNIREFISYCKMETLNSFKFPSFSDDSEAWKHIYDKLDQEVDNKAFEIIGVRQAHKVHELFKPGNTVKVSRAVVYRVYRAWHDVFIGEPGALGNVSFYRIFPENAYGYVMDVVEKCDGQKQYCYVRRPLDE